MESAPVTCTSLAGTKQQAKKLSLTEEKVKDKAQKNVEQQRSLLGVRDPMIAKKHGVSSHKLFVKSDGEMRSSESVESVPTLGATPTKCVKIEKDVGAVCNSTLSPISSPKSSNALLESPVEGRPSLGNSTTDDVPFREKAVDGTEGCEVGSWPEFSLDSLDAGEIDDIDMSGTLALPELEEMSQKEQSQTEPEASVDTRPSEMSSRSVQQAEQNESTSKSGGKNATGKKKAKVDWTPELHRRFVQAVEQLGVEKAIPSRILELMGVKCLTRHNIASHLQKYRSHRRHLAAREAEAANWHNRKPADAMTWPGKPTAPTTTAWAYPNAANAVQTYPPMIQPRPVVGVPQSYQAYQHMAVAQPPAPAVGMPMHVWGHPSMDHSRTHMWQQPQQQAPAYPPPSWFAPDGSVWHYTGVQSPSPVMDTWGQPSMVSGTPCYPQAAPQQHMAPSVTYPMAPGLVCGAPVCGPGMTGGTVSGVPTGMVIASPSPLSIMAPALGSACGMPPSTEVIADEAMPNPMFPMSDDLSLDFAAIAASLSDDLSDASFLS